MIALRRPQRFCRCILAVSALALQDAEGAGSLFLPLGHAAAGTPGAGEEAPLPPVPATEAERYPRLRGTTDGQSGSPGA